MTLAEVESLKISVEVGGGKEQEVHVWSTLNDQGKPDPRANFQRRKE